MIPVDEGLIEFLRFIFHIIFLLIRAGEDKTSQEDALMQLQEGTKKELDRRKFGATAVVSAIDVSIPEAPGEPDSGEGMA